MLLAVDVGNTQTVIGVFQREELVQSWRVATVASRTPDELAVFFSGLLGFAGLSFDREITAVAVASVVPRVTQSLRNMCESYFGFPPLVVGPGVKTGVPVKVENPREVGPDRIVNAVAAIERHGVPCVVADFGTATTLDVVSVRGEYLGGAIAAGLETALAGLVSATARLPRVELVMPPSPIGRSTVEAMQVGFVLGMAALVEGLVAGIAEELGAEPVLVATGGLAEVVLPALKGGWAHDPWLTLHGLRIVFERNARPR